MLSRGLLLFWGSWLSVVFASNLCDGLRQAGVLPASWHFASGNLSLMSQVVGIYAGARPLAPVLFGLVVLVELAAALLFWRAFMDREAVMRRGHPKLLQAFGVAIGLFGGFLVADEAFIVYAKRAGLESTHWLVLCALLLSLMVISHLGSGEEPAP